MIEEYYKKNFNNLVNIYRRRCDNNHHDAEDAVQEGFARAIKGLSTYDGSRPFDAWIGRIIENSFRDLRKENRVMGMTIVESEEADFPYTPPDTHNIQYIKDCISKKNSYCKKILELHFLKGYSLKQVSETLGVPYNTVDVYTRKFRGEMKGRFSV